MLAREYARRAFRALGRMPLVFDHVNELQALGDKPRQWEMLLLLCPKDSVPFAHQWVAKARRVVGDQVRVLLAIDRSDQKPLLLMHWKDVDDLLVGPFHFGSMYTTVADFMARHAMPIGEVPLVWEPYRLQIDRNVISAGLHAWHLTPLEFDLASEFFYNLGRTVSLRRLLLIVAVPGTEDADRSLGARIGRLRRLLNLQPSNGWSLLSVAGEGYRLRRTPVPAEPKLETPQAASAASMSLANEDGLSSGA